MMRFGTYTVQTGDELRQYMPARFNPEEIPALDQLFTAPIFAFYNGETGLWWAVETPEQADMLTASGVTIRARIFTRAEVETWLEQRGADSASYQDLPLIEVLRRGLTAASASPEAATEAPSPLAPAILKGDEPGLVKIEDGHGTWFRPVAAWAAEVPDVGHALGPDFFLNDAWMVGGEGVTTSIVVSCQDQKDMLSKINTANMAEGGTPFPVWGPSDLQNYVADFLVLMDVAAQARLVTAIQRAIVGANQAGEQVAIRRMAALGVAAPLFSKALLALIMAHETHGKSLLKCSVTELEEVHVAVGKLLLATGSATPFRRADLPKPLTAPEGTDQGGQYL